MDNLPNNNHPVAWMTPDGMHAMPADEKDAWLESRRMLEAVTDYSIPLYAAPVQPVYVPLSEEGIQSIAYDCNALPEVITDTTLLAFARAIEKSAQQAAYEGDLLTIAYLDGVHAGKKTNCVPLSDEQIAEISVECAVTTPSDFYFARAIERAVRGDK